MTDLNQQHAEFRLCHGGGAAYLAVGGVLWLGAASLGASGQIPAAMLTLLIGGMFIHPLASALSSLVGMPKPQSTNGLTTLVIWISLTIPLGLPFSYVYAMKSFLVLAGILVLTDVLFGFVFPASFATCGFVAGAFLLIFAVIHFLIVRQEKNRTSGS